MKFILCFLLVGMLSAQVFILPMQKKKASAVAGESYAIVDTTSGIGTPYSLTGGKVVTAVGITLTATTSGFLTMTFADVSGGDVTVDSVKLKSGQTFTVIDSATNSTLDQVRLWSWGLKTPASGADSIMVYRGSGSVQPIKYRAINFSGVNQSSPTGTVVEGNQGFGDNVSVSPTVASLDSVLVSCWSWRSQDPLTGSGVATVYGWQINDGVGNPLFTTALASGNGVIATGFTSAGSGVMTIMAFSVKHNP